ncbi:MAG: FxDxF family PEP-CTERM protein [Thiobacillus sp.]
MRVKFKQAVWSLALAASVASPAAQAAIQRLVGTNVTYQYDDAVVGLFGLPTLAGDSLTFTPTNFKALSSDGQFTNVNSTINVQIFAHTGYTFPGVTVQESGDYYLIGSDAQVAVGGQIRAYDLLNPLPTSAHITDPIVATAPLTTTTTLSNFGTTNWQADAMVNLPTAWSAGGINLTIENILIAFTANQGSAAMIEKKFVGTAIVITPVPEAETYAMMLAGLGLVGWMAGRRRQFV